MKVKTEFMGLNTIIRGEGKGQERRNRLRWRGILRESLKEEELRFCCISFTKFPKNHTNNYIFLIKGFLKFFEFNHLIKIDKIYYLFIY